MRKLIFLIMLLVVSIPSVWAPCPAMMSPPQRYIAPDDNTHALLVFDSLKRIEHLIIEPSFHGNASDFGMVMPTPSKPELLEADEKLFQELEDLTNPFTRNGGFATTASAGESTKGVQVIEVKDVGDFTATTLTASDSSSLINWLKQNNYVFKPGDEENFDYYVSRGGYFFVVLKVNMKKAKIDGKGNLAGKLKPIEFVFQSEKPMLPIRIMRSDMETMKFTIYVVSETPYYIPGTKVLFSRDLTFPDFQEAPTLKKYASIGNWLVRNELRFDFTSIQDDMYLEKGSKDLIVNTPKQFKVVNPDLLLANTGIIKETGPVLYIGEEKVKRDIQDLFSQMEKIQINLNKLFSNQEEIRDNLKNQSDAKNKLELKTTKDSETLASIQQEIKYIKQTYFVLIIFNLVILVLLVSVLLHVARKKK